MQIAIRAVLVCTLVSLVTVSFVEQAVAQKRAVPSVAERIGTASIFVDDGPSVFYGFSSNGNSSLTYDWVVVVDSSLGLIFDRPAGVQAWGTPANPQIRLDVDVRAIKPVAAYEIRVLTFDVWRRHTGTLIYARFQDIKPGEKKGVKRTWGGYTEAEARLQLTSILYVAKVRYQDGRTVVADASPVLRAAQTISASITLQDLEPTDKAKDETPTTES
jgi:hypothetical protein